MLRFHPVAVQTEVAQMDQSFVIVLWHVHPASEDALSHDPRLVEPLGIWCTVTFVQRCLEKAEFMSSNPHFEFREITPMEEIHSRSLETECWSRGILDDPLTSGPNISGSSSVGSGQRHSVVSYRVTSNQRGGRRRLTFSMALQWSSCKSCLLPHATCQSKHSGGVVAMGKWPLSTSNNTVLQSQALNI